MFVTSLFKYIATIAFSCTQLSLLFIIRRAGIFLTNDNILLFACGGLGIFGQTQE